MIRTVVTPQQPNISIDLPENFIGKQVKILAFTINDGTEKPSITDKLMTHFASEKVLTKDWLTPEEDLAWQNL
jgi:hypothetical protein